MEELPPPNIKFEKELKEKVLRWVAGGVWPLIPLALAILYLIGHTQRDQNGVITPERALGRGLLYLGMAIGVHGAYFPAYQRFPLVKWTLIILGVVTFIIGSTVLYRL